MKKLFSERLKEFKHNVVQSFKSSPVEIIILILFFAPSRWICNPPLNYYKDLYSVI